MDSVIEASGLTKKYINFIAVDNLNLTINKGEIYGLLGPNGAGKSTTILMLMGLTEPNSGTAKVLGIDPKFFPIRVKQKVGYLPEDVGFYNEYSGLENLVYTGRLNNLQRKTAETKALQVLEKVGLESEKDKKVAAYSRGMRQRLGLADVLIKEPEIIILDEPTLGIDPAGIDDFLDLIVGLSRNNGITVLFSSHHLHQVQQVCDRVGIFVKGKLLADGDINSLAKQLFSSHPVTINGEIVPLEDINHHSTDRLLNTIERLEGVIRVAMENNHFTIESKIDISAKISQVVVNSGFGLGFLNKKIYGLDDIYHQYFQTTTDKGKPE